MRHWPQSFKCWDCRQVLPHIAEVVVVMCVCVWYKCGAYMPLHAYRCQRIVWGVSSHFVPCWGRVYISDYFCCCAAYSRLVGTWTSWWFFCLCLPSCGRDAGLQICTITISFYMGLNSGHQAYYIAIFLTCWAMSPALFVYSWNKVSYSLVWLEPAPAFKLLYCSRLVPFCLAKLNFHYFLSALWKKKYSTIYSPPFTWGFDSARGQIQGLGYVRPNTLPLNYYYLQSCWFLFWDRISLNALGWLWTRYVIQVDPEFVPPPSIFWIIGIIRVWPYLVVFNFFLYLH